MTPSGGQGSEGGVLPMTDGHAQGVRRAVGTLRCNAKALLIRISQIMD